jgi:phosphatidylinositol dimannoside acyltransferase
VTQRDRGLEAPHRRLESNSRVLERAAVLGYRAAAGLLAFIPPRVSRAVIGTAAQASYLAWGTKRRYSNANFGHVLGLPPDHPDVRRLALRAYRSYARYMVELMRLPSRPLEELAAAVETQGVDEVEAAWRHSGGPLILVAAHVGNNEAVAAGLAGRGYPVSVVADDSAFPELFDHLRQQREAWGVKLIPWRNLRGIFGVLRAGEILALLVDWGYRRDGIPVRLFDAWTTLPAGPATLAAKTGATIAPVVIRRKPDGRFRLDLDELIRVGSIEPADLQRATQAMAASLERTVRAAPEQWYSFKPVWPVDPADQARLEARAAAMLSGNAAAARRGRAEAHLEAAPAHAAPDPAAGSAPPTPGAAPAPEAATAPGQLRGAAPGHLRGEERPS